jgi:sugar phosphate isomerase/epimerase
MIPNHASRRSFLKFGAAALAGATLTRSIPAFAADALDFAGLNMGAQSYTFRSMSFEKACAAMKGLGLKYIEIFPGHIAGLGPSKVKEILAANEITFSSYGVIGFSKDEKANRKEFEIAKAYGLTNLSCDPSPDSFDVLDKLVDEYNITVAIHPHGGTHRWAKIDTMWNAIKDHNPKIGVNNETGWLIAAGEDPLRAFEVFKGRVYAMHLKDFKKKPDGKGLEDVPAGEGQLQVDALVKKMIEIPYKGGVFVEYEGNDPVPNVQKSLDRVAEAVKKAKA